MDPINFKESNITFTKPAGMTDEECQSLPAYKDDKEIISCWKMTFKERIRALFTGVVWFSVLSQVQPPIWLSIQYPFVKEKGK